VRTRALPSPHDDLDAALARVDELHRQVSTLLATQRELSSLLVASQTRNGEQLKLLVAIHAIIEARDASGVIESLRDILLNVVGATDFTIYALDPRGETLVAVAGTDARPRARDRVRLGEGWLGTIVRAGQLYVAQAGEPRRRTGPKARELQAVAPLRVLDRVVGAIVIGALLPHREPLNQCDREILELLGTYAATAIIAAALRRRWRRLPDLAG
jgi:GAF domain-containing protein